LLRGCFRRRSGLRILSLQGHLPLLELGDRLRSGVADDLSTIVERCAVERQKAARVADLAEGPGRGDSDLTLIIVFEPLHQGWHGARVAETAERQAAVAPAIAVQTAESPVGILERIKRRGLLYDNGLRLGGDDDRRRGDHDRRRRDIHRRRTEPEVQKRQADADRWAAEPNGRAVTGADEYLFLDISRAAVAVAPGALNVDVSMELRPAGPFDMHLALNAAGTALNADIAFE
jgi:hypothetical protein